MSGIRLFDLILRCLPWILGRVWRKLAAGYGCQITGNVHAYWFADVRSWLARNTRENRNVKGNLKSLLMWKKGIFLLDRIIKKIYFYMYFINGVIFYKMVEPNIYYLTLLSILVSKSRSWQNRYYSRHKQICTVSRGKTTTTCYQQNFKIRHKTKIWPIKLFIRPLIT